MAINLLLPGLFQPPAQEDVFSEAALKALFYAKIAGSQATGRDGVRVFEFAKRLPEEASIIRRKALDSTYKFTNFKERLIVRGAARQPRQISIPTVRDRLTLRAVCQALHIQAPYSMGASPHQVVDQVVKAMRLRSPDDYFVRVDVRDFFPSIVHSRLAKELEKAGLDNPVRFLAMAAVRTPTGAGSIANERGVPQGLSISNALAALYMHRFDKRHQDLKGDYFRYVDDILLICAKDEAESVLMRLRKSLQSIGLKAHKLGTEGKTEIGPISKGIDFLGYRLEIEKVSVRESSYKRMFQNILKVITDFRYRKNVRKTLFRLNLKITGCIVDGRRRGWMMFFSRTENLSQLAFLDRFVANQLSRVGFPEEQINNIKKFVKSYHMIKFHIHDTDYIPNFDKYSYEDKISVIADMTGRDLIEIKTWNVENVDQEFSKIVSKEVQDLEADVGSRS